MKRYTCFYAMLLCVFFSVSVSAQVSSEVVAAKAEQTHARYLGKTLPLREMVKRAAMDPLKREQSKKRREREVQNFGGDDLISAPAVEGLPKGKDPLFKPNTLKSNNGIMLEPLLNFEAMDENVAQGVYPPDINGEVGAFHVVEVVNATWLQVFDKETGEALSDPIATTTIWSSLGISTIGDPVIAYDREAARWLLVEIGDSFSSLAFAVSEEDDPLGSWTAYEIPAPNLPDYPKLGIWSDTYVITTNEAEAAIYVLKRDDFLATMPDPPVQRLVLPDIFMSSGIPTATPADWDGNTPPPADALPIVVRMVDDAWGNYPQDVIELWTLDIDWNEPDNTQLASALVEPAAFDSDPCQFNFFFSCVPGTGAPIEGIAGIVMFRVQYRNFGDYETLLFNFLVDATGNEDAGARWMELRRSPGQAWDVFQEGTVATDDGEHRIMGSLAMDGEGNIALGYSVSGEDTHVATRITGRRYSDLPGEMTVDEFEAATGQSPYYENRWGDYTAMVLDPLNDQTFWYFGEYAKENNLWGTNITSFRLQRDTNDIGPYKVLAPVDASLLSDQEPVSIQVRNFGIDTQTVFQVGFQFENEPPVIEDVNYTLAPDSVYEHTFAPSVDMSVIGDYEFSFFTVLDGDEAPFNDTLHRTIRHLPRFDAGIVDVLELTDPVCDTVVEAFAELKNFGTEPLTSVNIYWSVNGGAPQLYEWTGNLAFGETVGVPLAFAPLQEGNNTISLYTELPNGMSDEVPANDEFSRDVQAITSGGEIVLELHTDDYPTETTWKLFDETGNVLYSGGPYEGQQTSYFHSWCLPANACFTFVIYDSYGDGIAYGGVEGYYTITDAEGNVLASIINPSFGDAEENDFCTSFGCSVDVNISLTSESEAGAEDGAILIEPTSGAGPFMYSIDGGMSFQSDNLFEDLPAGSYDLVVTDANGCGYAETIELPQCQVSILVEVTDESGAGAMDGVIEIQASGIGIPAQFSIDGGQTFYPYSIFEGLSTGTYQIVVQGPNGCQGSMEVFVDVGSSTTSAVYGLDIKLYPNPTPDFVDIRIRGLHGLMWTRLKILSADGRVVGHGSLGRYGEVLRGEISLRTLPAGPYFLKFEDERVPLIRVVKF